MSERKAGERFRATTLSSKLAICFNLIVEPISVYTKFLVNARCKYEAETQQETRKYCPGYSDAMSLPFEGSKSDKLQKFSDVFCSRCQLEDKICHQLFCKDGIFKRSIKSETAPDNQEMETNNNITCKAAGDWSNVVGMDDWCFSNCPMGNDDTTCLVTYCDCRFQEETTTVHVTTLSALSLTDCNDWEASSTYSGVSGMTTWCKTVCRLGACPPSHCQCTFAVVSTTESTTTAENMSLSSSTGHTTDHVTTSSTLSSVDASSPTLSSTSESTHFPTTTMPLTTRVHLPTDGFTSQSSTSGTERSTYISTQTMSSLSSSSETSSPDFSEGTTATFVPFSSGTVTVSSPSVPPTVSTDASSRPPSTETEPQSSTSTSPPTSDAKTTVTVSSSSTPTVSMTVTGTPTVSISNGPKGGTSSQTTSSSSSTQSSSSQDISTLSTLSTTGTTTFSSSDPSISESTSSPPLTSSTQSVTTTKYHIANETERMLGGLNVMNNVICAHTSQLGQTTVTNRFCDSGTQDDDMEYKGYSIDIIDRVLKFAPSLMCSFMAQFDNSECSVLYCGESPLIEAAIKSSICSVCRKFAGTVGSGCSAAYCSA